MDDHAIAVVVLPALSAILGGEVCSQMTRGRVVPEEERFICFDLLLHPVESVCRDLLVYGLHALLGQWACVLNFLFAHASPARLFRRIILIGGDAVKNTAGSEHFLELRILGI